MGKRMSVYTQLVFVLLILQVNSILTETVVQLDLDPNEAQQHIEGHDQTLKYAPKIESNVPAVRYIGNEPQNVAEDIYLANQYHGQDGLGSYLYGYSVPDIAKTEKKKAGGDLKGAYNYIAGNGQEIKVEYWDDGTGFHQIDNVPRVLPQQIDDLPDVKAAKDEHARRWQEEAERNSKPIANPYPNSQPGAYAGLGAGVGAGQNYPQTKTTQFGQGQQHHSIDMKHNPFLNGNYQGSASSPGSTQQTYLPPVQPGGGVGQKPFGGPNPVAQGSTGSQTYYAKPNQQPGQHYQGQASTSHNTYEQKHAFSQTQGQSGFSPSSSAGYSGQNPSSTHSQGQGVSQGHTSIGQSGFVQGQSSDGGLATQYNTQPSPGQKSAFATSNQQSQGTAFTHGQASSSQQGQGTYFAHGQSSSRQPDQGSSQSNFYNQGQSHGESSGTQYQAPEQGQTSLTSNFPQAQPTAGHSGQQNFYNQAQSHSQTGEQSYSQDNARRQGQASGNNVGQSSAHQRGYGQPGLKGPSANGKFFTGQQSGYSQTQNGQSSGTAYHHSESKSASSQTSYGYNGDSNSIDSSGQYSDDNSGQYNAKDDEGAWKPDQQEQQGPPRGFWYNFDYPVGIIVSKGGSDTKRDAIHQIYENNKASFEQQLKGGAAIHGAGSYPSYQVHS